MQVCVQKSVSLFPPYEKKRKSIARKKHLPTWRSVRDAFFSELYPQNVWIKKGENFKIQSQSRWKILQKILRAQSSQQNYWKSRHAKKKVAENYWQRIAGAIELNYQQTFVIVEKLVNYCWFCTFLVCQIT